MLLQGGPPQPQPSAPYAAPPYSFDHTAMLHQAMSNSNAAAYPQQPPEWIMDSGASSHVTDVLVSPDIVKNLISGRKFTRDNYVSIEFDPFGFSVKDLATKTLLLRSNSDGDLYPFNGSIPSTQAAFSTTGGDTWHMRLGHPSAASITHLPLDFLTTCNNTSTSRSPICAACQLGRQARLPFPTSSSHYRCVSTSPLRLVDISDC
ncbi:hypothetical protein QYE76_055424 [Lolium multiflorum]|uniref:GAG-pre-integrase domain-containing protein n=1 Tax=Lolium multiflorum TaxID=4521 RepID=A0AAD8T0J9_LOLMU|nr:hypothetical protein QYE76_055424 [Lolium multiflorum]